MDNIQKYQKLYREYKELLKKTSIETYTINDGGKITVQNIAADDLEKRKTVETELLNGLAYLTDNQLIELSGDPFFATEATSTLTKRRQVQ